MKKVCVIGGSRYFGRRLIGVLTAAGADVTVINRGSASPPPGTTHLIADRGDEAALRTAVGSREFDVVVDQVCYTPVQADIAKRVFTGRTGRYVMTSTVEVYDLLGTTGDVRRPLEETAVPAREWPIDLNLPWQDPGYVEARYGEGKRQAEAVFTQDPAVPFLGVRVAHVLGGGSAEFTGRLRHYVDRIATGTPIDVYPRNQPATFIEHREMARFLAWAAAGDFTGVVNAASHGELTVTRLCELIAEHGIGRPVWRETREQKSPLAFAKYYGMDNSRATELGFDFNHVQDWIPHAIADTIQTTRDATATSGA